MASAPSAIDIERIRASQYMSVAGLVILIWDHILTLPDEVHLIWSAEPSVAKALFLFNRYVVPLAMTVQTHEFSGITPYLNLTFCKVGYAVVVAVGMLSIATSNFLVLLRLWAMCDRSRRLMLGTLAFFVVTQIAALGIAAYVIKEMIPALFYDPLLRICVPRSRPTFPLLWWPGIAFEFMVFLTTVWNALDRPRSRNAEMTKVMYRDGSLYFFGLFALRLVNLVVSIVAPISLIFLGVFFLWSVSNITLARLILNLRRLSNKQHTCDDVKDEEEAENDAEVSVERTELPVLERGGSMRSIPELQDKMVL